MNIKSKKFQVRLSALEALALTKLALREGVSKAQYLREHIRREAYKKGFPV